MAINTMNIKLVSHEIIKPSCPTPNHLRLLQASLFDHVNSPTLMPLIFFFNYQKANTKISTNEVLYRLKGSLPNTLSMFYPLAGRMQDANYFICNDEGVPYVQSKVDLLLEDVVHKAKVCELDKLLPSYGQEEGFSNLLLAIQVNVFACGGIAIGVKMNHAISDAFSLSMFVKTWASIANNNGNNHHALLGCPNFEISKLFPPSSTPRKVNGIDVFANQDTKLIKDRPVTKWFMFHKGKLNALKSTLSSSSTSIMVLSAFIWSRIKVSCHKSANDISYQVFHSVNLRPKLAPLNNKQSYYFGNIFVNAIAKLSMIQVNNDDKYLNESLRRDFLDKMKESIARIIHTNSFLQNLRDGTKDLRSVAEHYEREYKGEIVALGFSNLKSLQVYEVDFGWGKPVWVTSATLMYKNTVIFIPFGPSSNDIIAYINLTAEDMAKLESDIVFSSFLSKEPYHISSKL